MKTLTKKRFIYCLIINAFGVSCTGGKAPKSTNQVLIANQEMQVETNLSTFERNIATRICYAYRSKASNFYTSDNLTKLFKFSFKKKSCEAKDEESYTDNLRINLSGSTGFSFVGTTNKKIYSTIQIDSSGYLSKLCSKIYTNQSIMNTTSLNDLMIQIKFTNEIQKNLDSYIVTYFKKSDNNKFLSYMAERFDVRTQLNFKSGDVMGLDENYTEQMVCGDGSTTTSNFKQSFQSIQK